jgi:hypothetical protein
MMAGWTAAALYLYYGRPIIISDFHREDTSPVLPASLRAGLTVLVSGLCMASPLAAQKL